MAASQGRTADEPRYNGLLVYVSLTTKTQSTGQGYAADVQPKACPLAQALLDATAP